MSGVAISSESTGSATGRESTGGTEAAGVVSGFGAVKGVLKTTPFRRLWYCTGLSSLGDWLGFVATHGATSIFFERRPVAWYAITQAELAISFLLMGLILAAWR